MAFCGFCPSQQSTQAAAVTVTASSAAAALAPGQPRDHPFHHESVSFLTLTQAPLKGQQSRFVWAEGEAVGDSAWSGEACGHLWQDLRSWVGSPSLPSCSLPQEAGAFLPAPRDRGL